MRKTEIVNRLSSGFSKFEDFCRDIANGISTSCDSVYIISEEHVKKNHFECHYIKPCIRGGQLRRFWCPSKTGEALLYVTGDFEESRGKNILKYLSQHRDLLIRKSVEKNAGNRDWHVLFRARYEDLFVPPKIIIRQTGDHVVAAVDRNTGFYCIDSVNVAAIKCEFNNRLDFLVGILNSTLVHFYYREISQETGRVLAQVKPQRLRVLPIPDATVTQISLSTGIIQIITAIIAVFEQLPESQTTRDPMMLAYWEQLLNGLVYELYFPEEVHGAGLRLFDLVEQANLPDVNTIPEGDRLPQLRTLFENLYDGAHPLRIALEKLQTLDTVRIIEGYHV